MEQLTQLHRKLIALNSCSALLGWDQNTYMPKKGATVRGQASAYIAGHAHSLLVSEQTRQLLDEAMGKIDSFDEVTRTGYEELRYQFERDSKVPTEFVEEMEEHGSAAYHAWVDAREKKDFSLFAPFLQKQVELHRKLADYLGYEESPYDALLESHERGMKTSDVDRIFSTAEGPLRELFVKVKEQFALVNDDFRSAGYDVDEQFRFCFDVVKAMGYDLERGDISKTVHPFMTSLGYDDVRICYRGNRNNIFELLSTLMHEAGHALYEQGFDRTLSTTIACRAASTAVHESQSRTWENIVGKSPEFWQGFYPVLQQHFPTLLSIPLADFVKGFNKVQPSFIRVEADELTYMFHIFLRFSLEKDMIEGRLLAKDVPAAWNDYMQEHLGIVPDDDSLGCLQDVHWSMSGGLGYFSTYALGNLYAAQFMEKAVEDAPTLWSDIAAGNLRTLREWQRTNIHQRCACLRPLDLIREVTGRELSSEAFVKYLTTKYERVLHL